MYPDKMKWMIAGGILILCMVVTEVRSCSSATDCKADECCLVPSAKANSGSCRKRATYRKPCIHPDKQRGGKYFRFCPCGEGLTCRMSEKLEAKYADIDVFFFMNKCYKTGPAGATKEIVIKEEKIPGGEIIEEDIEDR
ncbi:hypothetical protein HNY73_003144 [Argiope bruennichi]|uniref:Uncharacterized protein n=1 Tax=Argiope bruennichi TaxID=94029 RepID=A0A8T0G218_ARGBR|nr:hypothetical protein HNY73_003144 [Argiope bruennichi]